MNYVKTGKRVKTRRIYTEDFKLQVVKEYESGNYTVKELIRLYDLADQTICNWIYRYATYNNKVNTCS